MEATPIPETDVETPTMPETSRSLCVRCIVSVALLIGVIAAGVMLWRPVTKSTDTQFSATTLSIGDGSNQSNSSAADTDAVVAILDEQHIENLLGRWLRPDYFGDTILTLGPNGQGTMHIEFSTVYSYLVDDELTVDIVWEVKDGRCVFESVGGRPQAAFDTVTRLKGKLRDQKILEVNDKRAVFLDDKRDNEQKVWTRLPDKP